MSKIVRGRGRPEKFGRGQVQSFKNIVRKHGLLAGHKLINAEGVAVGVGKDRKVQPVTISLPSLSKYCKRDGFGGKAVALKVGRPRKVAA